jgi:2-desacetyl-2-hydroxyethyl bacteriochlorophyllide A dehydrogenase
MQALQISAPGQAALVDLPVPAPGPEEVLVRVAAAGICGSDLELWDGTRPSPYARYPIVPGHEWAGTVDAVGATVRDLRPGDPVVAEGFRACGTCDRCREGLTNLCSGAYAETGFTEPGAFAPYITLPASLVHRLPSRADLAAAALIEPAACVMNGLLDAPVEGAHTVVVGAGTLGLLAVLLLRGRGAATVTVVDSRDDRLSRAASLGADDAFLPVGATPHHGWYDLVFEATGNPAGVDTALRLARRGGTVVLEGIGPSYRGGIDPNLIPLGGLRVQGVFGASRRAWSAVVDAFSLGYFDPTPLITHRFPLACFAEAYATVRDPCSGAVKVLMIPDALPLAADVP